MLIFITSSSSISYMSTQTLILTLLPFCTFSYLFPPSTTSYLKNENKRKKKYKLRDRNKDEGRGRWKMEWAKVWVKLLMGWLWGWI